MADTLRYSIQGSPLAPAGFVGNYGRLQVDLRPTLKTVVISATDYDDIATALSEGRSINLKDFQVSKIKRGASNVELRTPHK